MTNDIVIHSHGPALSGAQFMRRVTGANAANVIQSSITGITVKVFDLGNPDAAATYEATLTVGNVVFNTLQTDARWTVDEEDIPVDERGYNFLAAIPPSAFPLGDTTYQVQFLVDPVSGDDFYLLFQHTTLKVRT